MGIEKTFLMDCDKCGRELTDSDGTYTAGREEWLVEHADMAGWKYDGGWFCGACLIEKKKIAEQEGRP